MHGVPQPCSGGERHGQPYGVHGERYEDTRKVMKSLGLLG